MALARGETAEYSLRSAHSREAKREQDVIREYVTGGWNQAVLDRYYKAPVTLSAAQMFTPEVPSEEATKAFHVADKVIAKRWVAHYHTTIVPPEAGRFRFIGFGDDFLIVRLGQDNVLDGSLPVYDIVRNVDSTDVIPKVVKDYPLYAGKSFDLDPEKPQSLDILIGEGPGGESGFILLIERIGDTSNPPDYPVFQVASANLPPGVVRPPFSNKTMRFKTIEPLVPDD